MYTPSRLPVDEKFIVKHVFETPESGMIDLLLFYQQTFMTSRNDLTYLFNVSAFSAVSHMQAANPNYAQYSPDMLDKVVTDSIFNLHFTSDDVWDASSEMIDEYNQSMTFDMCITSLQTVLSQMQDISPWITNQYYTVDNTVVSNQSVVSRSDIIPSIYAGLLHTLLDEIVDMLPIVVLKTLLMGDEYELDIPEMVLSKTMTGYTMYFIYE